jgi:hypothetical protein
VCVSPEFCGRRIPRAGRTVEAYVAQRQDVVDLLADFVDGGSISGHNVITDYYLILNINNK